MGFLRAQPKHEHESVKWTWMWTKACGVIAYQTERERGGWTYRGVKQFEGGVILVHFEIYLGRRDGEHPSCDYYRGHELGRGAEDHWAYNV
jgi:hypothetical protein